jgi:hypothetical protein
MIRGRVAAVTVVAIVVGLVDATAQTVAPRTASIVEAMRQVAVRRTLPANAYQPNIHHPRRGPSRKAVLIGAAVGGGFGILVVSPMPGEVGMGTRVGCVLMLAGIGALIGSGAR